MKTLYKVFTLFPEVIHHYITFNAPLTRGIQKGILQVETINYRDYSYFKHQKVDDLVYGGGPGMLIRGEPLLTAIQNHSNPKNPPMILIMDPKGVPFTQNFAKKLSQLPEIFFICGRYEGMDSRLTEILKAQPVSLGDFVLTGGELAALAIIDATARLIQGTLDSYESQEEESFSTGWLEYENYTRPPLLEEKEVPKVLLSGNHKEINLWRKKNSIKNTIKNRPDLLKELNLNSYELTLIKNILKEIYSED